MVRKQDEGEGSGTMNHLGVQQRFHQVDEDESPNDPDFRAVSGSCPKCLRRYFHHHTVARA